MKHIQKGCPKGWPFFLPESDLKDLLLGWLEVGSWRLSPIVEDC